MLKNTSTALVLALFALGQPALAQDTTTSEETQTATQPAATDAEPATETEAEAEPSQEGQLSLGEEAVPEPYVRETSGDWQIQCLRVDGEEEPCQMLQQLKDDQGTNVAEVTIFKLKNGGRAVAGANVLVPLETLLSAQLSMSVDGAKAKRYPYSFCSPIGCFARIGFTAEDIANFKKGANAKITLVPAPAPDQKVVLTMSLSGFTSGFDKATEVSQ
ncbi:invasion associated locus B family protein [Lentibacter algarum]|uniref:invasion associated locus B family protein n=1 Tax=Lentibacter algarum TaxID=576131 RepID=UPI001C07B04B|nr:invasion associated locus B family protein [Lentibacter algarum]MBU2982335.1 invasion associated locus B family protein [Lentibacter algarum]